MAERVKRVYDNSRRVAAARDTQRVIAEAARELFLVRGYNATSIRDIADAAGVAVQTIYNAYPNKPAILGRILDMSVVGDDEEVALADRPVMDEIRRAKKPADVIAAYVRMNSDIAERMLTLLPAIREAMAADAEFEASWRANAGQNRYYGLLEIAQQLAGMKALPKGMTPEVAADVLWVYTGPEAIEAFVVGRGWTLEQVTDWTTHAITRLLNQG